MITKSYSDDYLLQLLSNKSWQDKFWIRVDKTSSCWLWTMGIFSNGYGNFSPTKGVTLRAHRVSFVLFNNRLPTEIVRHTCDNKLCVNPTHLLEGTQQQNVDDRVNRNRGRKRIDYDTCIKGHPYVEGSYYINSVNGYRMCKQCILKSNRRSLYQR